MAANLFYAIFCVVLCSSFLTSKACQDGLPTQNLTTFTDIFGTNCNMTQDGRDCNAGQNDTDCSMSNNTADCGTSHKRIDGRCARFAAILFDDERLAAFTGEIKSYVPGGLLDFQVRWDSRALRCYLLEPSTGTELRPYQVPERSACSPGCQERSYAIFSEDRSLMIVLFAFIKEKYYPQVGPQGPTRTSVAGVIDVVTIRDSRAEAVTSAIRKLKGNDGSFSEAFLNIPATVVVRKGPRKYKVILKYKAVFAHLLEQ